MRWTAVIVGLGLAACAGGAEEGAMDGDEAMGSRADPAVLMEADRAFNAAVTEGGSEAWGSWFAEDGAVIREGVGEIRGREAVRDASTFLDQPGVRLNWEPDRADIAASGDLGWTTGRYVLELPGAGGEVVRGEGVYVSIWRRQADGSWKVVMDLGAATGEGAGGSEG